MVLKAFPYVKCLVIISVALLGFIAGTDGAARADDQDVLIVSQTETPTTTRDTNASPPPGSEAETQTDEKRESSDAKKEPIRDFKPSEQIEAEQAVDFPYDI